MRFSGSQMSGYGNGWCDSVQAPLILITAFLRLARSTTFGRSAQASGGAGGTCGCRIAIWSMMKRVSGWRSISAVGVDVPPEQHVDREIVLNSRLTDPVEARVVRLAL